MSLESLANELLLTLFEFLTTAHLLRGFRGLNVRFDTLIISHFRMHGIDFQSVSKHDFDIVCREHLPSISDRIVSLLLSEDIETPQQISHFLAHDLALRQFTQLRSLVLTDLCSNQTTVCDMMMELPHLSYLTHLTFSQNRFQYDHASALCLVNSIWILPKLIYCYLGIELASHVSFPAPSVTSLSLERLIFSSIKGSWSQLALLFKHTPNLQHLDHSFDSETVHVYQGYGVPLESHSCPSLAKLNLTLSGLGANSINRLLKNMNNLSQLTMETTNTILSVRGSHMDGHRWEQIICDYLPKLKVFRLKMSLQFVGHIMIKQKVNELVDSFQSRFWLDEHQWFVLCVWNPKTEHILLFTVPYFFAFLDTQDFSLCKSTGFHDDDCWLYNHVHNVVNYTSFRRDSALSRARFYHLRTLSLSLPINNQFWSIIPRFDQLISLTISLNHDYNYDVHHYQVQALLDRAPRLYSLTFHRLLLLSSLSTLPSLEYTNTSVRQLIFSEYQYFNDEECIKLTSSLLGIQCEVLSIVVKNRTSVLNLVNTMKNLRAIRVRCGENKWGQSLLDRKDDFVKWLQYRLPSTCSISRANSTFNNYVFIWIR
jgi:hypothetical protein